MKIWIHYEGDRVLKPGFRALFEKVLPNDKLPKFVPGEAEPIRSFFNSIKSFPEHLHMLLIDSDKLTEEFGEKELFEIIRLRRDWKKQPKVSNNQLFFMVKSMESWFFTDHEALIAFYGNDGFHLNALPKRQNTEEIENPVEILQRATERTSKGEYDKTRHAPELLSKLSIEKITSKTAPHAKRLFETLTQKLNSLDQ